MRNARLIMNFELGRTSRKWSWRCDPIILAFGRTGGNAKKLVRIAGNPTENQTRYFSNTSKAH
jgi:hypothetical protein